MNDILEISSDSDTPASFPANGIGPKEKNMYELDSSDEETIIEGAETVKQLNNGLIEKLYKKYVSSDTKTFDNNEASTSNNSIDLTNSPERKNFAELCNESYGTTNTGTSNGVFTSNPRKRELEVLSDSSDELSGDKKDEQQVISEDIREVKSAKLPRKASSRKVDVENARAKKLLEKAEKKLQLEKEKALKIADRKIQKSLRPEECLKNIIVTIDQDISQQMYGDVIKNHLRKNDISFKSLQRSSGLISWIRKTQTLTNMICKEIEEEEKYYLTIISAKEFEKLTKANNLKRHMLSIKENCSYKHLTIVIYGKDKPNSTEELAIMEINMDSNCSFQFAKKPEDLGIVVYMTTKSVAQIPYKLAKEETYKNQNQFFNDCNRDSVLVDKTGNGLSRLWHQMLTMFPLARLETAEAIAAAYPTPSSLFKAYENDSIKGEELIQNLPIRRAYGPLAAVKKIGPELSKKCHNFFTSEENILI